MDELRSLLARAQAGEAAAREQLAEENMGLVWSVARRFLGRGYELEDLFQIGCIGLLKSIDKFDLSYDVKFSTYAVPMIMGEIKRFLRDDGPIKVSRSLKEIAMKARHLQEKMIQQNGVEPGVQELSEGLGVPLEDLLLALEAGREVESLYATLQQGDGRPVYLADRLSQPTDGQEVDKLLLKEIVASLPPKERQLIVLRYFRDLTQAKTAEILGISQVQVSRMEKKILASVRERFMQ